MEYNELVKDFAQRTRRNLAIVRQASDSDNEAYEVTQLINSMLGLLVFPQQEFIDQIPETPIFELKAEGWPIPKVRGGYPQVQHLKGLIGYLRNGISHFNIRFISSHGEITGLIIWNIRDKKKNWEAELTLEDLDPKGNSSCAP